MPGVGISDFGASFIHYRPGVVKTLNNTSPARAIPLGKIEWEGEKLLWKVQAHRNIGIGNTLDGGAIPAAGKQGYIDAESFSKFIVGSVQISDGVLARAATTKKAAISALRSELDGLTEGIRKWENYQFTRDGTAVLGLVDTAIASGASGTTVQVDDARALWDKKTYEIRSAASPATILASFEVKSVARAVAAASSSATKRKIAVTTQSFAPSANVAAGDYITWGAGDDASYGIAWTGLDALINDGTSGTFQTVDLALYPRYTSPVLDNAGVERPLVPTLFRQLLAMIKQESGQEAGRDIVCMTSVWDGISVEELYEGEVRITPDSSIVGLVMPTFQTALGKVRIMTDPDSPYGKMFFVDRNEISRSVNQELDWRKSDGGGIMERSNTFLGYVGNAVEISEMVIDQRNRCGKIEDLKVNVKSSY